jgi:hypothetical protein
MKDIYTGEQLFIIAINSLAKLGVQYIPLELVLTSTPNVQTVFVVGRNNPFYQYNSGEDSLMLSLDFHAQEQDFSDVKAKCDWLRSLRYNSKTGGSEKIKLVYGNLFLKEVWVIKNCVIKYSHFHREKALLPKQAFVELSLGLDGISTGTFDASYEPQPIYREDISG